MLRVSMYDPLAFFEGPSEEELLTIVFLDKLATRLGNPPDLTSQAGLKLMDGVIGVWMKHFPQEAKDWAHDVKIDLENEKSLRDLNKDSLGLFNPASYPPMLFKLIKAMFPGMKVQQKQVYTKLIQLYPDLFKTSNYI